MSFEDICERLKTLMLEYFIENDKIVDNIITDDSSKVLSAKQGVILKELIDSKTPVLVDSATLKVCEEPDVPVEGYEVGDKYVDFLLFTEDEEHIYCLLTEFVKCDWLEFSSNKVTQITNESTHEQYPSAKSVYNFHDSSKVSVNALDESVRDLGFIKTHPVQANWKETDPTKLSYIVGKPNIRSMFVGKVADVVVENGVLKVTRFEESDFDENNHLFIIYNNQFVVADESFVISVLLTDDSGDGISGKTIILTGSDGSVYSSTTDSYGVCNFTITGIVEDVTYTANYADLSTSCLVELCLFVDYAVKNRHNHNYHQLHSDVSRIEELDDCKKFYAVSNAGNGHIYIGGTTHYYDFDCGDKWEITYDVLHCANTMNWGSYNGTDNYSISTSDLGIGGEENFTLRFICDGSTIKAYVDEEYKTQISVTPTGHSYLRFNVTATDDYFKAKNIRIKQLNEYVLFYDKGSIDNHKDNYTNTGFTRSFNEDYTTLTETTSGVNGTYKTISFPQNCTITLKIKCDGVASNGIMRLFNGDTALGSASLSDVGLTQDNQFHQYTITCYSDGRAVLSSPETETTLIRTYSPFIGNISLGFWSSGDTEVISFKELKISKNELVLFYDSEVTDTALDDSHYNLLDGFTRTVTNNGSVFSTNLTGVHYVTGTDYFTGDFKLTCKIKNNARLSGRFGIIQQNSTFRKVWKNYNSSFNDIEITRIGNNYTCLWNGEEATIDTDTISTDAPCTFCIEFYQSSAGLAQITIKDLKVKAL